MPSADPSQTHQDPPDPSFRQPHQNENQETTEIEDDEEGECGFCVFMKAGGCRVPFIHWEKCVDEAEKNKEDIIEKCHDVTKALKDCMVAHPDHYGPILEAEEAAKMEAIKDLEKEKEGVVEKSESKGSHQGSGLVEVEKVAI